MKFIFSRRLRVGALIIVALIVAFAAVPAGATTSGTNGQIRLRLRQPEGCHTRLCECPLA